MSDQFTEIPRVQDRMEPVICRLRLVSDYIAQPGVNQLDVAADVLHECAEQMQSLVDDFNRANAAVYKRYGCGGKVSVNFHLDSETA